jgi:hypothetical protein
MAPSYMLAKHANTYKDQVAQWAFIEHAICYTSPPQSNLLTFCTNLIGMLWHINKCLCFVAKSSVVQYLTKNPIFPLCTCETLNHLPNNQAQFTLMKILGKEG